MRVAIVAGTRPEAIKIAPVYHECKKRGIDTCLISTGQHESMLYQVFDLFSMKPDFDLAVMRPGQTLSELSERIIRELSKLVSTEKIDFMMVQGDTTSAFLGALVSFYHRIPVGHIEAGLRTGDIFNPYPEEANRKLISCLAEMNFAPTKRAKENLIAEGYPSQRVFVVGNSVVDALFWVRDNYENRLREVRESMGVEGKKYILLTMHRRESWGEPMRKTLGAIKKYLEKRQDIQLVFPLHLNPAVREVALPELDGLKNAVLTDPLGYFEFAALMEGCHYIMTDSGGIQEEAPCFGKPTLVLREKTERPEAIEAGTAVLVGTESEAVLQGMKMLEGETYAKMAVAKNPFGDGTTAQQIMDRVESRNM